ncbi:hypothetical protein FGRMN_10299 [Fusarium graminum]|nr:hypothetical protein FGRMN_10299 [Fusarium graminum]
MATSTCININQVKAAVEWQWEGATRTLATADPDHDAIRFTLQLDSTKHDKPHRAHLQVMIPVRFKDKPAGAAICLRISPFFIKSFSSFTKSDPSDAIKQIFDSTITCFDFELNNTITILVPSDVKEPLVAARPRSGKILDSLYELSHVTALRIYLQDSPSLEELKCISESVEQGQIEPFSDPDYDISRMFNGSGAKVASVAPPQPPSYEKATNLPSAPSYKRKRPRQDSQPDNISQLWDKLQKLESIIHEVGELRAENSKLREQKPEPTSEKSQLQDLSQVVQELRTENAQLHDKVALLEKKYDDLDKKYEDLETKVALSQFNGNDTEEAVMIEIRDDIESLECRVTSIESAIEEDSTQQIKDEIFDDLAARILRG